MSDLTLGLEAPTQTDAIDATPTPEARQPPSAPDSEITVLGSVLADRDAMVVAAARLSPDMFFWKANGTVIQATLHLHQRSESIDVITLGEELKRMRALEAIGGFDYLAVIIDATPSAANLQYHVDQVEEKAVLRRLIATASKMIRDAYEEGEHTVEQILDRSEERITRFRETKRDDELQAIEPLVYAEMDRIDALGDGAAGPESVRTGFPVLDQKTTGLHRGELCIVAARPSMGKTAWVLNVAANVALGQAREVAFFSLEMPRQQLAFRLLCSEARLDIQRIRGGSMSQEESDRLAHAGGYLNTAPMWIDDSPTLDVTAVRSRTRRLQSQLRHQGRELGLVAVDYLQLLSGENPKENRTEQVGKISRGLKALARELSVPVIALSQLSRGPEQRTDKRPILSDLRESGSIEQDADLVLFLFRPEYYQKLAGAAEVDKGAAELIIAKQRNGPVGLVPLFFRAEYMRFDSLTRRQDVGRAGQE